MTFERPVMDVEDALVALDGMLKAAPEESSRPLAFAIVDDNGDLVCFARMDGVPAFNTHYARQKAYTSSRMRQDLQAFAEMRRTTGRSLSDFADPGLVGSAGGGVAITDPRSGRVVGAIGVSGGTPEEDDRVARAGLAALKL